MSGAGCRLTRQYDLLQRQNFLVFEVGAATLPAHP
jgi:hypothetical protein